MEEGKREERPALAGEKLLPLAGLARRPLNRRTLLKLGLLGAGGTALAGGGLGLNRILLGGEAEAAPDCVATSGAIGGSRQRTLEALGNVMLPTGGTHGATGYGVLDAVVYGKKLYEHLIDPYYAIQIKQSDLDAAVTDLSNGSICMGGTSSFWKLDCADQLGLVAYGTRRSDEGPAPNVSFWEALCLWFGSLFAPTISDPAKAYDLARFCGLLFYGSAKGFEHMTPFGYQGPNWRFNGQPSEEFPCAWEPLSQPT